jgi:hypothetical protein
VEGNHGGLNCSISRVAENHDILQSNFSVGARIDFFFARQILNDASFFLVNHIDSVTCVSAVKTKQTCERIAQLAAITRMKHSHLSVIRTGPNGQPRHNLEHRENGRNVSEYIPRH